MPYLVYTLESIALFECFLKFGGAPRIRQLTLTGNMVADPGLVEERSVDVVLRTGSTEREDQLVATTVRQYRMKEVRGGKTVHLAMPSRGTSREDAQVGR